MSEWEEKFCQLVIGLAGLYHRRETLKSEGQTRRASTLDIPIKVLIGDIRLWLGKEG